MIGSIERLFTAIGPIALFQGAKGVVNSYLLSSAYVELNDTINTTAHPLTHQVTEKKIYSTWLRSEQLLVKSCQLVASLVRIVSWAAEASVIAMGSFVPYWSALGCWASSIIQSSKMDHILSELKRDLWLHTDFSNADTKGEIAYRIGRNLIRVSLVTCLLGWSVLGGLYGLCGSVALQDLCQNCFYYGVLLFCIHLTLAFLEYKELPQKTSY